MGAHRICQCTMELMESFVKEAFMGYGARKDAEISPTFNWSDRRGSNPTSQPFADLYRPHQSWNPKACHRNRDSGRKPPPPLLWTQTTVWTVVTTGAMKAIQKARNTAWAWWQFAIPPIRHCLLFPRWPLQRRIGITGTTQDPPSPPPLACRICWAPTL